MSRTTKIIIAATIAAGAAVTYFLFATSRGYEIRKKCAGKLQPCNGNCHASPVQG